MKLYYTPGACSLAVHVALRAIGCEVKLERVDPKTRTTETGIDFTTVNPKGYVPALGLDSGEILTEAPALLQYAADLAPEARLAPAAGTLDRVRLQQHLNFISSELHKAFKPFFTGEPLSDTERPTAVDGIARQMRHLEAALEDGRRHLVGDTLSVADIYLFVVASWCNLIGVDLARWPNVAALVDRVSVVPAAREAMAAESLTG